MLSKSVDVCFILLVASVAVRAAPQRAPRRTSEYCPSPELHDDFTISQIVGKWHIVEHISDLRGLSVDEIRDSVCLELQLSQTAENRIEEIWNPVDEPDYQIKFNLSIKDLGKPSLWTVLIDSEQTGGQKAVMLVRPEKYMVVTHCDERNGLVWTDVLSREPSFPREEIDKINQVLGASGLDVRHVAVREDIGC